MSQVDTNPTSFDIATTEIYPYTCDFTNLLGPGETISAPSCILRDLNSGHLYGAGLTGNPSSSGNTVTQVISNLVKSRKYELLTTIVITSKTTTWTLRTIVNCVV